MHYFGAEKETDGADLENNVLIPCTPVFAVGTEWEPKAGEIRYEINRFCALRLDCQVECIHCGGRIQIIEDGQEAAAAEQNQESFHAKDWKEGDALPPPTQKNLEEAQREVTRLEQQVKECQEGTQKEQLQEELDQKKELYHTIKETKEILEDIHFKQLFEMPVSNPAAAVEAMEESGQLQKQIESGYFKETRTLAEQKMEQAAQQVIANVNTERIAQGEKAIDLEIDRDDGCWDSGKEDYYFPYAIESKAYYCMPVLGAQVHLYFPTGKEWEVVAVNSLRNTSIGGMTASKPKYANKTENPDEKSLSNTAGASINLTPDEIKLTRNEEEEVQIQLESAGEVIIKGNNLNCQSEQLNLGINRLSEKSYEERCKTIELLGEKILISLGEDHLLGIEEMIQLISPGIVTYRTFGSMKPLICYNKVVTGVTNKI